MYARVTTFQVDPSRLDELGTKIAEMKRLIEALPGLEDAYVAWRGDGQGAVVAVYRTRQEADAAMRRMQVIWGNVAGLLAAPPRTDAYENVEHITD